MIEKRKNCHITPTLSILNQFSKLIYLHFFLKAIQVLKKVYEPIKPIK